MDYDRVYQLKKDFPQLTIAINGGIKTIEEMKYHLQFVDGVMVGREAYQNPSLLGYIDQMLLMQMRISSHQDKRWKPCSLILKNNWAKVFI